MWGREVKCKCCGIKCHVKCITDKIPECTKKPIDPEIAGIYNIIKYIWYYTNNN